MKTIYSGIFPLLYFLMFSCPVLSQNNAIDSLKNELSIHKEKDTIRVKLLIDIAFLCYRKDLDKTILYINESEAISKEIGFKKGKGQSLYLRGVIELVQLNLDQALLHFQDANQIYQAINYKKGLSKCYNTIGIVYYYKGDQEQSIAFYKKSIKADEELGDDEGVSSGLMNVGTAYSELGNYKDAIIYYKRALNIKEKISDIEGMSDGFNNLGTVYADQGNHPLALEYYNKSLSICKKLGDSLGQSKSLNNIGIIYKEYENYDKAMECYKESLKIQKKFGNKKNIAGILNNIGNIYKNKGDYEVALKFLKDALKISEEIGDKDETSRCLNNIGDIYLNLKYNTVAHQYYLKAKEINIEIKDQLGLCNSYLGIATIYFNQKKYNKALINTLKSNEISTEIGLVSFNRDAQKLLSEIYSKTGNYKKAFESYQQFKLLNDSLFNEENIEKITQLEYEYKYKQELESANNRELKLTKTVKQTSQDLKKSQQNFLIGIIVFLLVTILLGGVISYLKLRNIKSKTQNIVIEQKLLRSQMTPHFIFNSLSVLQGMILNKEDKKSITYLSKFSKLLRIILENSRYKTVSLLQEITAVESYLALQNLENECFKYAILVDDDLDKSLFQIPPMLIQPFVENAIEHAFGNQTENKKIDIKLSYLDEKLTCTIIDNGVGVNNQDVNKRKDKKSLSTTITSERLKMLSKDFKMKGSLSIEDRDKYNENGTIVTLVIPYKT